MKIAIDISQAIYGTGVSVYTKNLAQELIKQNPNDEFILFGGSLRRRKELKDLAEKLKGTSKIFPFPPSLLDLLWNSFHILPIEKLVGKVDLVHTSDWTEPPSKAPKITTVHDLVVYKYPQTSTNSIRNTHRKKLAWVARESEAIIAVSQSTKDDLISILGVPENKITVIPEGVEARYCPQPLEIIDSIKRKHKIDGDYIFSLSTLEPRKNRGALIKAFEMVKKEHPDLKLVIGGGEGWGEKTKPVPGVIMTGFLDISDLPALYSGSSCFALPSLYEGFGLPHLEAMASGTPVVGSNISSMPEVVGDAGVLVDPKSPEDIAQGIIQAINHRGELIKKGRERSKNYTWENTAKQTYKLYKQIVN